MLNIFSYSNAYSACKHLVKFGKKFTPKLAKEHGERPQGFSELYFEANDICPGQNLNGIFIKYSFINDILEASTCLQIMNPERTKLLKL